MILTIYDMVKRAADTKGISIAEVERRAEISNGTISKWKTGKPRVETLYKVAFVLNTEMSNLIPM